MTSGRLFLPLAALFTIPFCASAQSVVATHSGVVHYFEGSVSIDGQPLEPKIGKFYDIKPGSEFHTQRGRAEVMLTPGVMLRLDENSSIRMVTNRLADTRLEFIAGAAILDSTSSAPGDPITIAYKEYQMRFAKSGRYRMDSEPAQLRVDEGEAQVACHDQSVMVKAAEALPFSAKLVARADGHAVEDGLDRWEQERTATVAADNSAAADSDNLSSALNNPQNSGAGGAYDPGTGYYGGLTPDPYSLGGYAGLNTLPYWLYSSPLFMRGFYPMYVPLGVYRQPLRTGIYRTPVRSYSPTRTTVITPSRSASAPRPVVRPTIHR